MEARLWWFCCWNEDNGRDLDGCKEEQTFGRFGAGGKRGEGSLEDLGKTCLTGFT